MKTNYLLCVPVGGWNDTLCRISHCFGYAHRYNLKLVIDTKRAWGIKDDFHRYFSFSDECPVNVLNLNNSIKSELLRNNDYLNYSKLINVREYKNFSFSDYPPSDVLIYHSDGGGLPSEFFLSYLIVDKNISHRIKLIVEKIPSNYWSIVIRNTDYKTNYFKYFETILNSGECKFLHVASDDKDCVEFAKKFFPFPVFNFSQLPKIIDNCPLLSNNYGSQYLLNSQALVELFISSNSQKFIPTLVTSHVMPSGDVTVYDPPRISGFVSLANFLYSHSNIRRQILNIY